MYNINITIADDVVGSVIESSIGAIYYWARDRALDGGGYTITEYDGAAYRLDREKIARGLGLMAAQHPRHFCRVVDGSADHVTGDVLIQLALFGELKYG